MTSFAIFFQEAVDVDSSKENLLVFLFGANQKIDIINPHPKESENTKVHPKKKGERFGGVGWIFSGGWLSKNQPNSTHSCILYIYIYMSRTKDYQ